MEDAKKARTEAKRKFTRLENQTKETIKVAGYSKIVERRLKELSEIWKVVQDAHDKLLSLITDDDAAEVEDVWIMDISKRFYELEARVEHYIEKDNENGNVTPKVEVSSRVITQPVPQKTIQLERMKFTVFNGDIRRYPKFKEEFTKHIEPLCHEDQVAFILKSYLAEQIKDDVDSVGEDIEAIWERLDSRYGNKGRLIDTILADIKNIPICINDDTTLSMVNTIERAYRDLDRMSMKHEINNSTIIGIIEEKLPEELMKEWIKEMVKSKDTHNDKFPRLFELLKEWRSRIEYQMADIRVKSEKVDVNFVKSDHSVNVKQKCWFHKDGDHPIWRCREFQGMTSSARLESVKANNACYACLDSGHVVRDCPRGFKCREEGCRKNHHQLLHGAYIAGCSFHFKRDSSSLLQLQKITGGRKDGRQCSLNVLWDSGSTLSFITFQKAEELKLVGKPVTLQIITVGGERKPITSYQYELRILDNQYNEVGLKVFGLDSISNNISKVCLGPLVKLFENVKESEVNRPEEGEVDVLIGYEYAAYHPVRMQAEEHLVFLKNRFGGVIAGFHESITEKTHKVVKHANVYFLHNQISKFFEVEDIGINSLPKCGSCRCGTCHPGGKEMSLKEEREYEVIEKNLVHDPIRMKWKTSYPWKHDPELLLNNRCIALATLKSTERRLLRNADHARLYKRQMNDMLERNVARKVSKKELVDYDGPKYYISHHAVMKPESKTTPCRIVFNSSAKYQGYSLNDYYMKGPSLLNRLLGVLLRFRMGKCAFIGDISKMFHSIETTITDHMTHLFLWRDLEINKEPDTYAVTAVNMGDRPSATIAQVALRKTAEMEKGKYSEASAVIIKNSYMDDILGSVETRGKGERIMEEISYILAKGGFKVKAWIVSGDKNQETDNKTDEQREVLLITKKVDDDGGYERVLGIKWDTERDCLTFACKGMIQKDITEKSAAETTATKREILSTVNSIFDPMGLLAPFTVKAKILLRNLWTILPKLEWDDPIPERIGKTWVQILIEMQQVRYLSFQRSVTPEDAIDMPSLIIFSDASTEAYGAVAYIRWKVLDGYECRLIMAKSRIAPLKVNDIVKLELCGAIISKRLRCYIQNELRFTFERVYHIVDSEIVKAMVNKNSYGFNTFVANRIGEIHQATSPEEWYWLQGKMNIADWITRGRAPCELHEESVWQKAPAFLQQPESEWPIQCESDIKDLPEQKINLSAKVESIVEETLAGRIDISRFSRLQLLINTTARVLKLYEVFKLSNNGNSIEITTEDIKKGKEFWLKDAQKIIQGDVRKGKYKRLCPRESDGLIVVGGRAERWMEATWNKQLFILLPGNHRISELIALYEHKESGHLAAQSTIARIRLNYWIIGIKRIVNRLIYNCVSCKKKFKKLASQVMSPLPVERLQPTPPFTNVGVDYFGPFIIRGEVQKRIRGKCFGVIFTCFVSRAVYVDIAHNYSTDAFMQTVRRFASVHGWPKTFFSDNGSQLVAASKELKDAVKNLEWNTLQTFGHKYGTTWSFPPADAPWYNGATESLIKSVKRALNASIGDHILMSSELQTVMFEAAQLVNQRPIGSHPTNPEDGTYLTPNDLILGRASNHVPQGPFQERTSLNHRFDFLQKLTKQFWVRWIREVFPNLIIQQKWHVKMRDLKKGDVVLVQDSNVVRGEWRMAIVVEPIQSEDGRIRKALLSYKDTSSKNTITISRPIQKLIVLVPVDE